ncbi:MAG: ATPase [Deltaproteobacteria bacterium CG11_big_fil_rev_8_21_14_0_20_49_13]|nr:MAG: ATPase [Deltaproteobacteria bacterium CG11_big_fil_rev_8_21_14_0_20_49_13]
MIKEYIKRESYLKKIGPFINKDIIKVLVGERCVGKSYILYQIMDMILEEDKSANIIYINKELSDFDHITDHKSLLKFVEEKTEASKKRNFLFIDEIQDIISFEKALRSLKASGKYDIYCTGSNANMLSSDLSTYLSGRYIEIEIHSLSYAEFLLFHKLEENEESLLSFIKYGGLPYLIHLELNDDVAYDYLRNVKNTILFKDIISRFNIRNVAFLERLVEYIADNLGSLVSAKKISDFLKSQQTKISPSVVLDYLSHLRSAFFIHQVQRQDIKGKKIFEVNDKYFFEDLGLRNSIISYNQADIGKVLENLVFSHLKASGYNVRAGQLGKKEIDFIGEKDGERLYVQVAYLITDENREREFGNLLEIDDNYPKLVVSMDTLIGGSSYKGIKHVNLRHFLTSPIAY